MEKLSLLIFSKDDIAKALDLIDDLYEYADEIVVIDSSNKKNREHMKKEKSRQKLAKVRIFYAIALGYPDPLRMYALTRCTNEWILLVDTDERLSDKLKKNLKNIIQNANCDAFAIKRFEDAKGHGGEGPITWQTRIFKKDKIEYRGMVHEQAIVHGTMRKIEDESYYMNHFLRLRGSASREYSKIDEYERMSYKTLKEKFLENTSKFMLNEKGDIRDSLLGKAISTALTSYQKIKLKRAEEELSDMDYYLFYLMRDLADHIRKRTLTNFPANMKARLILFDRVRHLKSRPDSEEAFKISQIINEIGIIKFLNLDKPETIETLNAKFKDKHQGISLLIKLMREQYVKKYR